VRRDWPKKAIVHQKEPRPNLKRSIAADNEPEQIGMEQGAFSGNRVGNGEKQMKKREPLMKEAGESWGFRNSRYGAAEKKKRGECGKPHQKGLADALGGKRPRKLPPWGGSNLEEESAFRGAGGLKINGRRKKRGVAGRGN